MQPAGLVEQAVARTERRLASEHERHVGAVGGHPVEQLGGVADAAHTLDPVPAGVALGELRPDEGELGGVLVDRDDEQAKP